MGLNFKQELFVDAYLVCRNAAEAARRAGYSRRTARQQGSRLLTNVDILAAIDARLAEADSDADEVLRRLVEHARGSMGDFLTVDRRGEAVLDFSRALDKLHLIKKLKKTVKTFGEDGSETTYELELYDAQAALVQLGKYHRLFTDRVEVTDVRRELEAAGLDYDDIVDEIAAQFEAHVNAAAGGAAGGGLAEDEGDAGAGTAGAET